MVEPLLTALLAASVPFLVRELVERSGDLVPMPSRVIKLADYLAKQQALLFAPRLTCF